MPLGARSYSVAGGLVCVCQKPDTCNGTHQTPRPGSISKRTESFCRPSSPRAQRTNGFLCTPSFDKRLQNYHERATGFFHSGPAKVVVRPLTRNGITNRILAMAKQAGVKLSMHRLRKGFGCRVAKQLGKGNAPVLHELMRHSSMQITMDYYANVDEAKQAAIAGLT